MLEITATQEDPNAEVEIEGNKDLENGSIIKINVKAEDGSFTRYFINIEKGSSGISPIIIVIIILFLLLGGCIGIIIYRKKKKEEAEFDKFDDSKSDGTESINNPLETEEELPPFGEPKVDTNEEMESNNPSEENYSGDHVANYVGNHEEGKQELEGLQENEKDV